ncbi:hypothetical protein HPY42_02205 [Coprothermobacteraceae bacterium]|nr:hypothetical protein [Coprothermobacteraceae bacterium]
MLLENGALRASANRYYTAALYGVMLFLNQNVSDDESIWRLGSRFLRRSAKVYRTALAIRKLRGEIEFAVDREPLPSEVRKLSNLCHILVSWCVEQTKEPLWTEKSSSVE